MRTPHTIRPARLEGDRVTAGKALQNGSLDAVRLAMDLGGYEALSVTVPSDFAPLRQLVRVGQGLYLVPDEES